MGGDVVDAKFAQPLSQAELQRQQLLIDMRKKTNLLTDSSWIRQQSATTPGHDDLPSTRRYVKRPGCRCCWCGLANTEVCSLWVSVLGLTGKIGRGLGFVGAARLTTWINPSTPGVRRGPPGATLIFQTTPGLTLPSTAAGRRGRGPVQAPCPPSSGARRRPLCHLLCLPPPLQNLVLTQVVRGSAAGRLGLCWCTGSQQR